MLEIIVSRDNATVHAEPRKSAVPEPTDDEVLVQVVATSSNPKDWKAAAALTINQGDDIAGVVVKTGSNVYEFKSGDRVAAFHKMFSPGGAYAEYAVAPQSTTFRLPDSVSFEAAATLPLASMTAALALYQHLKVPLPWSPVPQGERFPLLIYGAASAVGLFAVKFAKMSNANPIIGISGNGIEYVKSLGLVDYIVDYRRQSVVEDVKAILQQQDIRLLHAFDCVSKNDTWNHIVDVLEPGGAMSMVDPPTPPRGSWPKSITYSRVFVSTAYGVPYDGNRTEEEAGWDRDFAQAFYRYLSFLLHEGRFDCHPYEIQPGGLLAVQKGVQRLYDGNVSATKLVYRISDTPHLEDYN